LPHQDEALVPQTLFSASRPPEQTLSAMGTGSALQEAVLIGCPVNLGFGFLSGPDPRSSVVDWSWVAPLGFSTTPVLVILSGADPRSR